MFFFNATATTEIYTLSLHDALPISPIHVESAGTHDYHVGEPADGRAIATARDRGYDLTEHLARSVTDRDFQEFDYLIALDEGHLRLLNRQCPATATPRIELLLKYAPDTPARDVPDPYMATAPTMSTVSTSLRPAHWVCWTPSAATMTRTDPRPAP